MGKQIGEHLSDARQGANKKIPLAGSVAAAGLQPPGGLRSYETGMLARRDGVPLPGP